MILAVSNSRTFRIPGEDLNPRGICTDWIPTLTDREGPVYLRIVAALAADIESGRLSRGQQLPTHRALAKALGIDLTTATRAYTEARHRGLTEARVEQGTFVVESLSHARRAAGPWPEFDPSMNRLPQPLDADLEGRLTADVQPFNLPIDGPNYRLSALRPA